MMFERMEEMEMIETARIEKILMQQLQLLHEESRKSQSLSEKVDASAAMIEIARLLIEGETPVYNSSVCSSKFLRAK